MERFITSTSAKARRDRHIPRAGRSRPTSYSSMSNGCDRPRVVREIAVAFSVSNSKGEIVVLEKRSCPLRERGCGHYGFEYGSQQSYSVGSRARPPHSLLASGAGSGI